MPAQIDRKFWDGKRWASHEAFNTISHSHVCCYDALKGGEACDITVVETTDGRWFIEDTGGDAVDVEGVWNPYDPSGVEPVFYPSEQAALNRAYSVVSEITKQTVEEVRRRNTGE